MTSIELRQKYLDFFKLRNHAIIGSASLIPENDPTVLFTTAGMHPLVPYLLGGKHPAGSRLVGAQKCIRTGDIEEVGDKTHHTFFEMMGNWSLGDYFKKESINYSWEFLTDAQGLSLDKNRLAVSVFVGDEDSGFDQEAYDAWSVIFTENNLPLERIARLPKKNNWWGPAGVTGPCGPDTEIFYWVGEENKVPASFNDDNNSWVEIWNNVFMQYNKNTDAKFELLQQKNVDTGLGLERTLAALNGLDDNYQTDLFINIVHKIEELSGHKYGEDVETTRSIRIVADHLKAATFIIGDDKGIVSSNTDQGYVVRRLIRRAVRYGRQLNIQKESWTKDVAAVVINDYKEVYGELEKHQQFIFDNLDKEEEKFSRTLENGLKELDKIIQDKKELTGQDLFNLYQSFGFPVELSLEELKSRKKSSSHNYVLKADTGEFLLQGFAAEMKKHQDLSRTASAGRFKGGLADAGDETVKLHTTAHLLLAALRKVLGDNVVQKGSNITAERLRLDFSHPDKMTPEQIKQVEDLVNGAIKENYTVSCEELSLDKARQRGAMGVFNSKYGELVKVYSISHLDNYKKPNLKMAFSQEICGGPHVENTGILGNFKIQKEEASSAGVRRIKAILQS
ncbi:alanine--tRNA ligase [Candidatus Falkowbacteria bacterium]|uniref:Alanine--tRNA ligase n=1 Tax=Candidatus Falkowbacteria bacterium CG10_big_fil_rev_8_21_14_0_10_37_18 TaxID=1974562 RepID=A0A2H0V915_9BACT|nr:alanine--tRNA ligase [Candidatus Falkowbacteria bacterium]NCQ12566.1 alanine--tRNA ligase [Candidatus Falkowbacteria bacterium]OIO06026.1 MAG: alanine--tRNA ligase [Candidatus Falkowbacteria bacterium CG1_02_37_21]PIR95551.1 MAG: alanine--tRNA ligase [Candidatus Falkowbacteria bacterium CG10_big_fil_rev_8_21_14_0_10_37_18]